MILPNQQQDNPSNPSSDYHAMAGYWALTDALLGGTATMRAAGEKYLPKFEAESNESYAERKDHCRFTNIFSDILENLAQKPFGTEVSVSDDASNDIKDFCEDVDGKGNSLHVFAGTTMFNGIAKAVDYILVDYTGTQSTDGKVRSIADEKKMGLRPKWCTYPADSVLAAYSDMVDGKEEFVHVRLKENSIVRDGWKEKTVERVRVLNREPVTDEQGNITGYGPATWEIWKKNEKSTATVKKEDWSKEQEGTISIGVIPFVPFIAGRRKGNSWQFMPPMQRAAELQVEYYQQENSLKSIKNSAAFPILSGNGISPDIGEDGEPKRLVVGPKTVLYAPNEGQTTQASWAFVEPEAQSLTFLASDLKEIGKELRELGRQPLTAQSGNLTVVTTAFAAQKGHTAIQAWCFNLKDALENALYYTCLWLKITDDKAEVNINTDFDIGIGDDESFKDVIDLYKEDVISRDQLIHEGKRRGIIDKDYDPDDDLEKILEEYENSLEGDDGEDPDKQPDDELDDDPKQPQNDG